MGKADGEKSRRLYTGHPAQKWGDSCVNEGAFHGCTSTTAKDYFIYLLKKRIKEMGPRGKRSW